jgi:DNA-directed RNA polymerase specialized sigma24 family protein
MEDECKLAFACGLCYPAGEICMAQRPEAPDQNDPQGNAAGQAFRTTHWSVVLAAGGDTETAHQALERLCQSYWYPLYCYVRRRGHSPDDAQDLTQAFFTRLLAGKDLAAADRERGRFRSFLLALFNHFLVNEWDRSQAQKRGGGCEFISLDYIREQEDRPFELAHQLTAERVFEKRWAEAVLNRVLARLRDEFDGERIKRFDALKIFLTEEPRTASYVTVAGQLGMTAQAVKSAIHRLRQRYGELLRAEIAQTLASPADVDDELRHLIRVLSQD